MCYPKGIYLKEIKMKIIKDIFLIIMAILSPVIMFILSTIGTAIFGIGIMILAVLYPVYILFESLRDFFKQEN